MIKYSSAAACVLMVLVGALLSWMLYRGQRATALPADIVPVMLPASGLYEVEQFTDRPEIYRWTNGAARLLPPNPGGSVQLALALAGGPERSVPVTLTLERMLHPAFAATFTVAPALRHYRLLLPPSAGRRLSIGLESPQLRAGERRTLGVVLGKVGVAGSQQVPLALVGSLTLASIGLFALLRQAKLPLWPACGIVAATQFVVLAWQAAWGWRYGIAEPLLAGAGVGGLVAAGVGHWFPPLPPTRPVVHTEQSDWPVAPTLALVLVLTVGVRIIWIAAPDPVGDLELSARRMAFLMRDGLAGAYLRDGDYLPLRLYMLLLMSRVAEALDLILYTPLPAATKLLLKLPGLLADTATTALIFGVVQTRRGSRTAAALATLYALTPPVWINVGWWGQVDGLLMLPMLATIVLLGTGRPLAGWVTWAVALLIKPQPILLAPLVVVVTLRRYGSRSLLTGCAVLVALLVLGITPLALAGQGPGIFQAYAGSVGRFPLLTNDAYNLWYLAAGGQRIADVGQGPLGLSYRLIGLGLLGGVALLVAGTLLLRTDTTLITHGAAVLALAFFVLPTQIHQRYLFLTFAFLALRLADAPRLAPIYALLALTGSINILGSLAFIPGIQPLIEGSWLPLICATLHVLALVVLLADLNILNLQSSIWNLQSKDKRECSDTQHS